MSTRQQFPGATTRSILVKDFHAELVSPDASDATAEKICS